MHYITLDDQTVVSMSWFAHMQSAGICLVSMFSPSRISFQINSEFVFMLSSAFILDSVYKCFCSNYMLALYFCW